jgi:predicted secreted acid phosphatase
MKNILNTIKLYWLEFITLIIIIIVVLGFIINNFGIAFKNEKTKYYIMYDRFTITTQSYIRFGNTYIIPENEDVGYGTWEYYIIKSDDVMIRKYKSN